MTFQFPVSHPHVVPDERGSDRVDQRPTELRPTFFEQFKCSDNLFIGRLIQLCKPIFDQLDVHTPDRHFVIISLIGDIWGSVSAAVPAVHILQRLTALTSTQEVFTEPVDQALLDRVGILFDCQLG